MTGSSARLKQSAVVKWPHCRWEGASQSKHTSNKTKRVGDYKNYKQSIKTRQIQLSHGNKDREARPTIDLSSWLLVVAKTKSKNAPWCQRQCHGLWWGWKRRRRCPFSGTAFRGRRWPRRYSCRCGRRPWRAAGGSAACSPRCSQPRWDWSASPYCLEMTHTHTQRCRGMNCHLAVPETYLQYHRGKSELQWLCTLLPVDSSAARMPFPGATILWAISCSSFFCLGVKAGYWWVMVAERGKAVWEQCHILLWYVQWWQETVSLLGPSIVYTACLCRWSMKRLSKLRREGGILQAITLNLPPQNLINIKRCDLFMCFLVPVGRQEHRAWACTNMLPFSFGPPPLCVRSATAKQLHKPSPFTEARQQLCNMAAALRLQSPFQSQDQMLGRIISPTLSDTSLERLPLIAWTLCASVAHQFKLVALSRVVSAFPFLGHVALFSQKNRTDLSITEGHFYVHITISTSMCQNDWTNYLKMPI